MSTITDIKTRYKTLYHTITSLLQGSIYADGFQNILFGYLRHLRSSWNLNLDQGETYVCFHERRFDLSPRVAAELVSLEEKSQSPQETRQNSTLYHNRHPPKQRNRELSGKDWILRLPMSAHGIGA